MDVSQQMTVVSVQLPDADHTVRVFDVKTRFFPLFPIIGPSLLLLKSKSFTTAGHFGKMTASINFRFGSIAK
jgi:hypothetical protein